MPGRPLTWTELNYVLHYLAKHCFACISPVALLNCPTWEMLPVSFSLPSPNYFLQVPHIVYRLYNPLTLPPFPNSTSPKHYFTCAIHVHISASSTCVASGTIWRTWNRATWSHLSWRSRRTSAAERGSSRPRGQYRLIRLFSRLLQEAYGALVFASVACSPSFEDSFLR